MSVVHPSPRVHMYNYSGIRTHSSMCISWRPGSRMVISSGPSGIVNDYLYPHTRSLAAYLPYEGASFGGCS